MLSYRILLVFIFEILDFESVIAFVNNVCFTHMRNYENDLCLRGHPFCDGR